MEEVEFAMTQIWGSEKWPGLEMHIWESSGNLPYLRHIYGTKSKYRPRREASLDLSLEVQPHLNADYTE